VYPDGTRASISRDLESTRMIHVFVGPSGCCGKTTALLWSPASRKITRDDHDRRARRNDVQSKDRDVSMVFQEHALYRT